MRGERAGPSRVAVLSLEIPPRARGTEDSDRSDCRFKGNTPACAGNGHLMPGRRDAIGKYPRVRGERRFVQNGPPPRCEIPPRARGTDQILAQDQRWDGNTPACAGNGDVASGNGSSTRKYPRVRGERLNYLHMSARRVEIPPRARGTGSAKRQSRRSLGNTPACAGNGTSGT